MIRSTLFATTALAAALALATAYAQTPPPQGMQGGAPTGPQGGPPPNGPQPYGEQPNNAATEGTAWPVIFVTGKDEVEDRVQGLKMGADDYICKPFQPAELTARVEAVLRRYRRTRSDGATIQAHGIEIDAVGLCVNMPGRRPVALTPTEMKVLVQLAQRPGETVEREEVMASVWGDAYVGESNIVDVYVRRLRRKLERDPAHPELIHSARGVGYKFIG